MLNLYAVVFHITQHILEDTNLIYFEPRASTFNFYDCPFKLKFILQFYFFLHKYKSISIFVY